MSKAYSEQKKLLFSQKFYSDLNVEGGLYGSIIRSPLSSGIFRNITFLKDIPDEVKSKCQILTAKDFSTKNEVKMFETSLEIFCKDKIHYKGEPLGILLSEDEKIIKYIFSNNKLNIEIEAEEENIDEKKTLVIEKSKQSENFSSDFFEKADFCIEGEWTNQINPFSMKETNGAIAIPYDNKIQIFAPNHWLSHLENTIADITGIKKENIFISRTNISIQNTNAIWLNEITTVQAVLASLKTNKTVKITYTREEQETFIENPAEIKIKHKTALDKDGRILSMDIQIETDIGFENPFTEEIAERLLVSAMGIYKSRNFKITSKVFSSKETPKYVNLSSIAMHSFFAVENQIQKIAIEMDFSPKEIRLKNIDFESEFTKNINLKEAISSITQNLDSSIRIFDPSSTNISFKRTINETPADFSASDFERKLLAYKIKSKTTKINETLSDYKQNLKGIAISCAVEGNGYSKRNLSLKTELREDGKFVIDSFPVSDSTWGIWTKTINDILKLDRSMVFLNPTMDTNKSYNWPDTLCENISTKNYLLKQCCLETLKGNNNVSMCTFENDEEQKKLFHSTVFAVCLLELEIDPYNVDVKILRISVTLDCGRIYNTKKANFSIKLEIQNLLSQFVKNETLSCNEIDVNFVESKEDFKPVGHILQSILPSAFSSALSVALNKTINKLPITKEEIYYASKNND